jgi:hypothetical protein
LFGFLHRDAKGDNPLDNPHALARWFDDLPKGDIAAAQKAVVAKLIEFNQGLHDYGKARLQTLTTLDELARDMQASLSSQYLHNPLMSAATEARLWALIHAFYFEIARSYHAFLMHYVASPSRALKPQIPLITARTLRALAAVMKWRYFHAERIDEKLWLRLHNLFLVAEFEGFQSKKFMLYSGDSRPSSCREEYAQALMLSLFSDGNLMCRQIEMIDQWLDRWSDLIQCEKVFDAERHCFYVDSSDGQGLRRVRNPDAKPAWRFVSAQRLRSKIDAAKSALEAGKDPVALGLGENFHLPDGLALLERVQDEWAPLESRERRRRPRKPGQATWDIVRDLENIFIVLQGQKGGLPSSARNVLTADEVMDLKLYGFVTDRTRAAKGRSGQSSVPEDRKGRWFQIDTSDGGIGFVAGGVGGNWAKAGRLVAVREEGSTGNWEIGVIRRVMARQDGQRVIGVQLLRGKIVCIDLEQEAMMPDPELAKHGYEVHDASHGAGDLGQALLVTDPNDNRSILLESSRYGHGREYLIRLPDATTHLVQLESIQGKGEGWLRAAYKTLA